MLCPMMIWPMLDDNGKPTFQLGECVGEKCAWWDGGTRLCAYKLLALELANILLCLRDIALRLQLGGRQ